MGLLLLSIVFAVLPLVGIALIVLSGWLTSVDGLFTTLILLALSAVFAFDAATDLHRRGIFPLRHSAKAPKQVVVVALPEAKPLGAAAREQVPLVVAPGDTLTETGVVERVEFFEAPVGHPDTSLVTLCSNGSVRLLPFSGDVRPQLAIGRRVRLTYSSAAGQQILLSAD